MTSFAVVFMPEAGRDLAAILAHIATSSGQERAGSVIGRLIGTCLALDFFPHRGRPRDDLSPGLRVTSHRGWASSADTIEGSTVTIQGVLWRGRDILSAFGEGR